MHKKWKKALLYAVKVGIGSSVAIWIATKLNLDYATSAGSITLLTILTTKWETVKLSIARMGAFMLTVILSWLLMTFFPVAWVDFGILMFVMIILCEALGWQATVSVNALIGTHFMFTEDLSIHSFANEFWIVVIGISVAMILNLYHPNETKRKNIYQAIEYVEKRMAEIMEEIAEYLVDEEKPRKVFAEIEGLEEKLIEFNEEAYEYKNNVLKSHPEYFINYFEMRQGQCNLLHNLYYEVKHIEHFPMQAQLVADYMRDLAQNINELNVPTEQIDKLNELFIEAEGHDMPKNRKEFESRALLFHIMLDLKEFLFLKNRFVQEMNPEHYEEYWKNRV